MSFLDDRRLARKLRGAPAPEPPPGLLEALRREIPGGGEIPHGARRVSGFAAARRPLYAVAASLVMVAGGGWLAWQMAQQGTDLMQRPEPREAAELDLAAPRAPGPPSEEAEEAATHEAAGARQEALSRRAEPAAAEADPPAIGRTGAALAPSETAGERDEPSARSRLRALELSGEGSAPAVVVEESLTVTSTAPERPETRTSASTVTAVADEPSLAPSSRTILVEPQAVAPPPPPPPGQAAQRVAADGAAVRERVRSLHPEVPPSTGGTTEPNDQPYGDVFFRGYGVNPFVDTDDDVLSTFGLKVDTGSYTVVRRYLRDGHRPPPEAVRLEELVNFFTSRDPQPASGDFALHAQGMPSPWPPGERYWLLRLGIQGRDLERAERRPAVLTFVVDVSGSMAYGGRLGIVRQALELLLDQLEPEDRVALVTYDHRARVLLPHTGDREALRRALATLAPGGSTNAEAGLATGYRVAREGFRPGWSNRVLFLSDGVANVGRTGAGSILERLGEAAREGIELTAVGVGMGNYNDALLEELARRAAGRYVYVDTLEEARRVFAEQLTGTLETIAEEARAQVEFDPAQVARYRLLGYESRHLPDERFRDERVDGGWIGAGHGVTVLYEVKLAPGAEESRSPLALLRLRYRPAGEERFVELERAVTSGDLVPSWRKAPRELRLAAVVARFAEALRGSYWARDADFGELLERARELHRADPEDARLAELVELIELAASR